MNKRLISALLFIAVLSSLVPASALSSSDIQEDLLMADYRAQSIINAYPNEIELVESLCNISISQADETTLQKIAETAINYYDNDSYDFSGLMTSLSVLATEREMASYFDSLYPNSLVDNCTVTPFQAFSALKGKYICDLPIGATSERSGTISIGIATGELISAVEIAAGISKSTTYEFAGPSPGETMHDGSYPTHRILVGAFWGSINKVEFDVYNPIAGMTTHHVEYRIPSETAFVKSYGTLAIIFTPCRIESATKSYIVQYPTWPDFISIFETTPSIILTEY